MINPQLTPPTTTTTQAISRRRPLVGGPSPASLRWHQHQQQPPQCCCLSTIREVVKGPNGLGQIPQERMRTMSIIAHIDHGAFTHFVDRRFYCGWDRPPGRIDPPTPHPHTHL